MSVTKLTMSPYVQQLVKENYLLTQEGLAVSRLPDDLQEKAVELSEAQRVQAMETIVSNLLNPQGSPSSTMDTHSQEGFLKALLNAAGQDELNRILPWWGRSGSMIRERFTVEWFKKHKVGSLIVALMALWFLWGLGESIFPYVAAPFHWTWNHTFAHHSETAAAPNKITIAAAVPVSAMSSIPVPTGLKAELIDGHRLRFSWNTAGPDYRYNIYSRPAGYTIPYDKETPQPTPNTSGVWTPHRNDKYEFVVTAVDQEDRESVYSSPIIVDLTR